MTVVAPISMKTFQEAVHSWFSVATELTTVWADQSTPQPSVPFGQLRRLGPPIPDSPYWFEEASDNIVYPESNGTWATGAWGTMQWGGADNQAANTEVQIDHSIAAKITVQCQVFVGMPDARDPEADADLYMNAALGNLQFITVRDLLQCRGISVFDIIRHTNTSALLMDARQSRALADVIFRVPLNMTEYVGYFSTAQISCDALGIDETIQLGD